MASPVLRHEQVQLWRSRVHYLGQYYCDWKAVGRGSNSCHVLYLPLLLTAWWTALIFMILTALHLQRSMHTSE